MKKKLIIIATFSTLAAIASTQSFGQCNATDLVNNCIPKLSGDFTFLKSYPIDGEGGEKPKVEYSYVFTKGTQYMINLCAGGGEATDADGVIITLFDGERKKLASSLVNGQYISAIAFNCSKTGIYYISYSFENSAQYCGGSALGFKRS